MIKTHADFLRRFHELLPGYKLLSEYTRAIDKIKVECDKGHIYDVLPGGVLTGRKCPYCQNRVKKTHEQFVEELSKIQPKIKVLGKYNGHGKKIEVQCDKGHIWDAYSGNLLKGHGCLECSGYRQKTHDEFVNEIKEKRPGIKVIGTYRNARKKVMMECSHGHRWEVTPNMLLRGNGCPVCGGTQLKTHEKFLEEIKKVHPKYTVIGKYVRGSDPIEIMCDKGHVFYGVPCNMLGRGYGCPICGGTKKHTHEEYIAILHAKNKTVFPLEQYQNIDHKILHKCNVCNTEMLRKPSVNIDHRCPYCYPRISIPEQELASIIADFIEIEQQKQIDNMMVDILVPSKNVVLEYNGLYWHSDLSKSDVYHISRSRRLHSYGYRTVHIWEDEWYEYKDVVTNKIKEILGLIDKQPIDKSEYSIRQFTNERVDKFLSEYYIGQDDTSTRYVVLNKNSILAVLFANKQSDVFHIDRIVYRFDRHYEDVLNILLHYCKENKLDIKIKSDYRWDGINNKVYEKLGMVQNSDIDPNFEYIYHGKKENTLGLVGIKRYDKDILTRQIEKSGSNNEYADSLAKVYDCGGAIYFAKYSDKVDINDTYYDDLTVSYSEKELRDEFRLFKENNYGYTTIARNNKIIKHFQCNEFYKRERELWKNNHIYRNRPIRDWLFENREKYIGKKKGDITTNELLAGFKIAGVLKGHSHFNVFWIKEFITEYKPTSIYDPCCGWGHRLLGAAACNISYIGNDINQKTIDNNKKIAEFIGSDAVLTCNDAANYTPDGGYDTIFTCPPYWNDEIYTDIGAERKRNLHDFLSWWNDLVIASLKPGVKLFVYVISTKYKAEMNQVLLNNGLKFVEEKLLGSTKVGSHFSRKRNMLQTQEYMCIFSKVAER